MKVTDQSNELRISTLPPKQQEFVRKGRRINRLGRDFCCYDFPELSANSFRQYIFKLRKKGWIDTVYVGTLAWYKIKGEYTGWKNRRITHEGMGVGTNMQDIINEASVQIPSIHDIKIKFTSEKLYANAITKGGVPSPTNKGIFLEKIRITRAIYANIVIYPETVIVELSCTLEPIIYDIRGSQEFIGHLKLIHHILSAKYGVMIQDSLDWTVTHYHLNQDGQTEFSDPTFKRTVSDMVGGFMRVYAKRFSDKTVLRLERIITPNCTVKEQVNDMLNVGNYLYSEKEDISHIMPSQILALNKFPQIVEKRHSIYNPMHYGVFSL